MGSRDQHTLQLPSRDTFLNIVTLETEAKAHECLWEWLDINLNKRLGLEEACDIRAALNQQQQQHAEELTKGYPYSLFL